MADQTNLLEQTVAAHSRAIAQINEILLVVARRMDSVSQGIESVSQQQEANAQQIAANAQAIAELREIIQDRHGGNEQRND